MAPKRLSRDLAQQAVDALIAHRGSVLSAARALGLDWHSFRNRLFRAEQYGIPIPDRGSPSEVDTSHVHVPTADAVQQQRIDRLKKDVELLKRENADLRRERLSVELVRQLIHDTSVAPDPPDWLIAPGPKNNEGIPTLLLSDWHWGETVDAKQVNYVNAYNKEIASQRLRTTVTKAVDLLMHKMANPKYDYLCMPILGDMLSGNIHEELRETNWAPITICLLELRDILIWACDQLLDAFGKLYIPCVVGNHGRIDRKPRFKQAPFESYEFILYEMLRHHYRSEKRVHVEVSESSELLYCLGKTRYLAIHGDEWRGGSGIAAALSPMMLGRARKKETALATNRAFDVIVHGHWHFYRTLGDVICNGSGKGYDEYAMKNSYQFQEPIQALWITHPQHGLTAYWPIYLEPKGKVYR